MQIIKPSLYLALAIFCSPIAWSQQTEQDALLRRLADDESRIKSLETLITALSSRLAASTVAEPAVKPQLPLVASIGLPAGAITPLQPPQNLTTSSAPAAPPAPDEPEDHDHMMAIPNGPTLHFRGFFDMDFDTGKVAQNLQYSPAYPNTSSFRTGEFDLFMTSQLSSKLSFLGEMVLGNDITNTFNVDLERYQLTWKQNKYFQLSAGRFHTAIGYYNTAYHHGTWFSTATGRPLMYYFEDSGGPLPVHELGMTATGEVPSGKFGLHWIAEVGNGRADAGQFFGDGVQTVVSDRNRKDVNLAFYTKPEWINGLQIGGSYLNGDMAPLGMAKVEQSISSFYVVYINGKWEFLNEAVLMHHQLDGGRSWNSPMGYTQLGYHLNKYTPYFRFQEVNIADSDPVSSFTGRYEGPSFGLRYDMFDYAAIKLQYNRVDLRNAPPENGFETQLAFTF